MINFRSAFGCAPVYHALRRAIHAITWGPARAVLRIISIRDGIGILQRIPLLRVRLTSDLKVSGTLMSELDKAIRRLTSRRGFLSRFSGRAVGLLAGIEGLSAVAKASGICDDDECMSAEYCEVGANVLRRQWLLLLPSIELVM